MDLFTRAGVFSANATSSLCSSPVALQQSRESIWPFFPSFWLLLLLLGENLITNHLPGKVVEQTECTSLPPPPFLESVL